MSAARLSLPHMLSRSLLHRRGRSFSALAALTVSALVAATMLTLYAGLDAKLHHEFRSFGANVVVSASGKPFTASDIAHITSIAGSDVLVAPIGYAIASTDRGTAVVVAGVDFATMRKLDSWWNVAAWPSQLNDALLGQRAAGFIANEQQVTLTYAGKSQTFHGVGRLRTGGDEDARVYIPLDIFKSWTDVGPTVVELQIPGGSQRIDSLLATLHRELPQLHAEPVRQLVAGEASIVEKTHSLMYGAVLLIALTVAVSVLATLSASVLERRRDFALMKALGASQQELFTHFLLEALAVAFVGVIAGYILGSGLAWLIGEINFSAAILPRPSLLPVVLLLNLGIAACAALLPARALRGLQPAALLKGE